MVIARERALLARGLMLKLLLDALCDAGLVDEGEVEHRVGELRRVWPEGIDPERLLDTGEGLSRQLEHAVTRARTQRALARAMRDRAAAAREHALEQRAALIDVVESLALLRLLDDEVFEDDDPSDPRPAADGVPRP